MMQKSELEKRYRSKIKFWYEKFIIISNEIDELSRQQERLEIASRALKKRLEKVAFENGKLAIELTELQQEKEEMSFDNVQ